MALETLLVLMNLKMKTSCNIRKDLPIALKMPQRSLREELRPSKEEMCVFQSIIV